MKRMITMKKRVTAAREAQILTFSELTPEQQAKAIDLANGDDRRLSEFIYSWYADMAMEDYHYNVQELANDFTAQTGIDVNVDELYWQSSSQRPYPEWKLDQVFDEYSGGTDTEYTLMFDGRSTDVDSYADLYLQDKDGEWITEHEVDCDEDSLRTYGADEFTIAEILEKIKAAQEFIDKVWSLVNDVCQQYPDDDWIADTMDSNDFEFLVDGDRVSFAG